MADVILWIKTNWSAVCQIIGLLVSIATIIVKITPNQNDDTALAKVIKVLSVFSLVNPDGSFIGKKDE